MTLRLAWFASARGTSSRLLLRETLRAIDEGRLDAEIVCVFCNRERGQSTNTDAFLDDVEAAGIPLITSSSLAWRRRVGGEISDPQGELAPWRREYDANALKAISEYEPDAAMLAGYMLVVTDALCDALPMLNLHPALPDGPIGTWRDVIRELIAAGASESGMMLQRVTTELDRGAVVSLCRYPIRGPQWDAPHQAGDEESALFLAIRSEGVAREPIFMVESLRAIADGRIDCEAPGNPMDLTEKVESAIAREFATKAPRRVRMVEWYATDLPRQRGGRLPTVVLHPQVHLVEFSRRRGRRLSEWIIGVITKPASEARPSESTKATIEQAGLRGRRR